MPLNFACIFCTLSAYLMLPSIVAFVIALKKKFKKKPCNCKNCKDHENVS